MTSIERINRFGPHYSVKLECGHTLTRTAAEIKLEQLYIDKRIGCPWCAALQATGWSDSGDYAERHNASLELREPNRVICVACRVQAVSEERIVHIKGCPQAKGGDAIK